MTFFSGEIRFSLRKIIPRERIEMERIICHCNYVEHDEIVEAIRKDGARTIEDIRNLTGANTSCGRCSNAVMAILKRELQKLETQNNSQNNPQNENKE